MPKQTKSTINAKGVEIAVVTTPQDDYISLTDIARYKNAEYPSDVIQNWMRNRSTVEFLGLWEIVNDIGLGDRICSLSYGRYNIINEAKIVVAVGYWRYLS